ncbi:MAG TPA: hypothetical protein VL360_04795 [Gammaproteobacteria bacterium]|nr:hypothetical protein [Gammaproteobacteria bacterium]
MLHRTLYAQPHYIDYSDHADGQHIQSDFISTYRNGILNDNERAELLAIMNEETQKHLRAAYLQELENRLNEMDEYHHPAVIPGRRIVADIKQNLLDRNHAISVLHHTISLANTSAHDASFQKKADNFLRETGKINSAANNSIVLGMVYAFITACALACAITACVMTGMLAAPQWSMTAFSVGMLSVSGIVSGLVATGLFANGYCLKSTVKDLGAFGSAMSTNIPQENKAQDIDQEHFLLLHR